MIRLENVIFYVEDVEASVAFFEKAFGLKRRFVDPSNRYGELETGHTALGFASLDLARSNLPNGFRKIDAGELPPGMEIAFTSHDVQAAFDKAVEAGAVMVALPLQKEWGQVIGYVRDPNGILVEIASEMHTGHVEERVSYCDHCD